MLKIGLLCLTGLIAPSALRGDPVDQSCPQRPDDTAVARKTAGKWFASGTQYVSEDHFIEAEEAFRCSYALVPHPATLLNLAKAAKLAGHVAVAVEAYTAFIERYPDEEKVAMAKSELEGLSPVIPPEEDATKVTESSTAPHERASTPPEAPEPEPPQPEPLTESGPALTPIEREAPPPSPPPAPRWQLKIPALTVMVVGATGTAAGLGLGAAALYHRIKGTEDGITKEDLVNHQDGLKTLGIASIATLSVGGAALLTGIALWIVDKRSASQSRNTAVMVGVTPHRFSLAITF